MDADLSKFWLVGAGGLVGAIAGAWVWAQRAAAIAAKAAQAAGDDALIQTAAHTGTAAFGAAIQGALAGGVLGMLAVFAYLYYSDPDRGMKIRQVETNDEAY
jgi:hypothetical protein